jgi:beta-lactamase regulating signal transducer with metallopeptidase domain/uncharacterized membrane protein YkoI
MRTISELLLSFLLNAAWQILLITGIVTLSAWLVRDSTARLRHLLWVAALVLSCSLPVITISSFSAASGLGAKRLQAISPAAINQSANVAKVEALDRFDSSQGTDSSIRLNKNLAVGLVGAYLVFLLFRGVRLLRAWWRTRAIARTAWPIELTEDIKEIISRCECALAVRDVRILSSRSIPVPITIGFRHPAIVLPEHLSREGEVDLLASAIGHELVHVRRRDYVLNLLYELLFLPVSFHPAAALVRRRINQTRELTCDELVAERLLNREVYARSLVQLAGSAIPFARHAGTITVGIADADILEVRIMSLLRRTTLKVRRNKLLLIAAAMLLAVPCLAAASLAVRFTIDDQDAVMISQEPSQQDQETKKKAEREARQREEREAEEREMKERAERDPQFRAELEARARHQQEEREMMAKRQAQLIRLAKINMDRAIQIATSQQPGKVLECSLVGEHWEGPGELAKPSLVLYHVVIFSGDESRHTTTHVLVNAVDGTIFKSKTEELKEGKSKEQP